MYLNTFWGLIHTHSASDLLEIVVLDAMGNSLDTNWMVVIQVVGTAERQDGRDLGKPRDRDTSAIAVLLSPMALALP